MYVPLSIIVVTSAERIRVTGSEEGEPLGFIAEEPRGFLGSLSRQVFSTHRPFRAVIMDKEGQPILWVRLDRLVP